MEGPETRASLITSLNDPASEEAWAEFAGIYRPLIIRVARSKGLQHADAEDLAQDVLAIVGRSIGSFDAQAAGSFRGWLFKITRNLVVNHLTRGPGSGKRQPIGSGDSEIYELLQKIPDDEATLTLFLHEHQQELFRLAANHLREQFSEAVWQSFWLTSVESMPISEAAKQLGKSEGAVRVARCRVLTRIRDYVHTLQQEFAS